MTDRKFRYLSGVLSFRELISPDDEQQIIDRFEATAFAGLRSEQFNCLWIRHSHNGRSELHFLTPRCELLTGKALNIRPPRKTTEDLFDTFRILVNHEFRLKEPVSSIGSLSSTQVAGLKQKLDRLTADRAMYNKTRYSKQTNEVLSEIDRDVYENGTRPLDRGIGAPRTRTQRADGPSGDALERFGRATRAMGAAYAQIEHAGERFDASAQTVGERAGQTLAMSRQRSVTECVMQKYGITNARMRPGLERSEVLELDRADHR